MKSKKVLGVALILTTASILIFLGSKWIHFRLTHAVTNAVFVESETFTKVAYRRVGGRIVELFKEEGDRVSKGEPLAKVEDRDIRLRLEELRENMKSVLSEIEALEVKRRTIVEEVERRERVINQKLRELIARIEGLDIRINQLRKDMDRFTRLFEKGVVPLRRFEEIRTELLSLEKEREALTRSLESLRAEREVIRVKFRGAEEIKRRVSALRYKLRALRKKERDLENMLEETVLRSPVDGYVVKRYVSLGEVVRPGQFVYAVYDPKDLYILVLLEETKLKGVKKGNRVLIKIDAFPDVEFEGVVKEVGRAVASKFALIPRDVTAGEFTKVVQRVPVKVEITKGPKEILRVGMGGSVAIERR
ncbi:MAG: HlyD family efflux transporter periplasmic adaptor subunit [Aquificota bacterium]|nr:HlyD family efflux transporter periplasmic adaptor subunit [Aquificota bacterium]